MFVSFTVNTKLKLLIIFLFKILCRQCWKTAAVHQRMIMLDEWDEDIELAPLEPAVREQFQPLLPSPIVPLLAVLVEWFPEWCTEEDWKDFPIPGRQVDEQIWIWARALLTNSERRKAGFREVSCCFLLSFIVSRLMFFTLIRFKVPWPFF